MLGHKRRRLQNDNEASQLSTVQTSLELQSAEDADLIKSCQHPNFSNAVGLSAPKLCRKDAGFEFIAQDRMFSCHHTAEPARLDAYIYTGCAVLCFFQLFYCPYLKSIVGPRMKSLVCIDDLPGILRQRNHGQTPPQVLIDHITTSFSFAGCNPSDMFQALHSSISLPRPIPGLPEPKVVFQCQVLDCKVSFNPQMPAVTNHQ